MYQLLTTVNSNRVTREKKSQSDTSTEPLTKILFVGFVKEHIEYIQTKTVETFTKAAENVVEVIKIIIAFFQYCFVAICDVNLSVGVGHCAGAEKQYG